MDPAPEKTVFVPRAAAPTDLFLKDDVVGQYKVEKVLGAGGMGVVYLVKHTALNKKFALKALPAKLSQEASFVRRFKKEAEMLGRLKHGHIVNVTDFGESQGRLYLVLEFVDGGTLEEWFLERTKTGGGVPPADVARMLAQILEGLSHAHQAGIVHRDLKPANVLLEKTGEAKISDFGLARVVEEEEYRRTGGTASPFHGDSVSTTGSIVGTIDFMSPEARNMRPSDARSDIFAVGVIAYYLLTGKKPHGLAKPASQLVQGLDPRWDKFIATCLAEDPAQRYQTAALALEGLKQVQQPAGGKRWVVPAAIAAVVAIAAGVWFARPAPSPVPSTPPSGNQVTLTAPAASPAVVRNTDPDKPVPNAALMRKFVLTGLPPGAVVHDGRRNHMVNSTGNLQLDLKPGAQVVRVKAAGYLDWEGEVGGDEQATEAAVPLERIPPHPVRFTGLPPQAEIKIGDQAAIADASGAATLELRPGRVTLTASAAKFENLQQTMEILQATETVPLDMKRLPPAATVVVKLPEGGELRFKWVPPGNFLVGSPADERGRQRSDLTRARTEILKGFYVAETETTQRQHRALTGRNPSTSRALGDENRPVEQVAWRDLAGSGGVIDKGNAVVRRLELPYKVDLPTEVEWEYACRAGTDTAFNDGSNLTNDRDDPALNALGSYARGGSLDAPSPVAKHKPNRWGLYDMHGNVAEWAHGNRGAREPVVRGGNWKVGPMHCRSASRVELTAETRSNDTMGYRLVLRLVDE